MSTSRTSPKSLKPCPSCALSDPNQPRPRDCLSQSFSCQDHPAHGEGAGNSCCTITPSLCPSGWSQASAATAAPCPASSGCLRAEGEGGGVQSTRSAKRNNLPTPQAIPKGHSAFFLSICAMGNSAKSIFTHTVPLIPPSSPSHTP